MLKELSSTSEAEIIGLCKNTASHFFFRNFLYPLVSYDILLFLP